MSGYKINWTKSALLPLNSTVDPDTLPAYILVVNKYKYVGTDIYPSLAYISSKNFKGIFGYRDDLNRWSYLSHSLQTCVSIFKMDILPRVNFFLLHLTSTSSHQLLGHNTLNSL